MKIVRERPCQRRHHRVTAPLWVRTPDGARKQATNWSLGDLRIDGWPGSAPQLGDELTLTLELPFQGFDIAYETRCSVVRVDPAEATVCFEFVELNERARDLMEHFIQDLIRGKMATVDDTICRIDVPLTPISTKPDPNPDEALALPRRRLKTIIYSTVYLFGGLAVFAYVALLIYTALAQLEVKSAVVSAPLQTLKMPVDGVLQPVSLSKGVEIRRGEPIAFIDDPLLESRIAETERRLAQANEALDRMAQRQRIEAERLHLYKVISRTERDVALARVEGRRAALDAADAHLSRIAALFDKGLATAAARDLAIERQVAAAAALREAEAELEQATVMGAVSNRRHYNHKEFVVDLDLLEVELSAARAARDDIAAELRSLQELQRRRVISAPFDGRVVEVYEAGGVTVNRNTPLAVIERGGATEIVAYLLQGEALEVEIGQRASVYLPAVDRLHRARVLSVDPSASSLRKGGYTWRGAEERTVAVTLQVEPEAGAPALRSGMPAVVLFDRAVGRDFRVWLSSLWPVDRA